MGASVFRVYAFLWKFIICLLTFIAVIVFHLATRNHVGSDVVGHMGYVFMSAVFYFFFPTFIMMIFYGTQGFSYKMYELVVDAVATICAFLATCLIAGLRYESYEAKSSQARLDYVQNHAVIENYQAYNNNVDEGAATDALITFLFIIFIFYLVDTIMSGAQKGPQSF